MPYPVVGVICGSGLSGLSATLQGPKLSVKYRDIPGFPSHCTVAGHKGECVFGLLSGVPAICFRGRFHSVSPTTTVVGSRSIIVILTHFLLSIYTVRRS